MTLIDAVQAILSDADGDEVSSIMDTVESEQCARVIQDVFYQIVDLHDLEHIKTLSRLDATTSSTPNVMTRPEGYHSIEWVQYDTKNAASDPQSYNFIQYVEPDDFLSRIQGRNVSDTTVTAVTLSTGVILPIRNDTAPSFYTVMDTGSDELVFDAYDSVIEANLQQSKSIIYGIQRPTLSLADASTFTVPRHLESLILREARAMYFDLFKDGITSEIDRSRRRMEVRAQRQRNIIKNSDNDNRPDYGRRKR
jgi:hypothetical protein